MSLINPIHGAGPAGIPPQTPRAGSQAQPSATRADFGQTLRSVIGQVDQTQLAGEKAVSELLSGRTQEIAPVVAATAKADLSFKLLIGVRNKVIEAYKQTMNMQV